MKRRLLYTFFALLMSLQTFAQSTVSYEYDANNRLTKVTYSSGIVVTYTYDELGNQLSKRVTSGGQTTLKGDVNGDGVVDTQDAIQAIKIYLNKITDTEGLNGDVNGDGVVDTQDAIQVVKIYLNK